jgi:predicted acetyltransferase
MHKNQMKMRKTKYIRLVKPSLELQAEYMDMLQDFASSDEIREHQDLQFSLEDFQAYVRNCRRWEKGIDLPDKWVPSSSFWLIRSDNVILGVSSLRHKLNKRLRLFGGNIGYKIRPCQRQKGYGTMILELTLAKAKSFGLKRVLVTCDDDNIASSKIIEKNGGVLYDKCDRNGPCKLTRRYWIDLQNLTLT